MRKISSYKPLILAPAGNKSSFLAALAAGADAIYCGLKKFSARMGAENFTIDTLVKLSILARKQKVQIYIVMNIILKPNEIQEAGETLDIVNHYIKPDAIIIQDLGFIPLIQMVGFKGQIHLSTLANVSFPKALNFVYEKLNIKHTVIPRELDIDEIKLMSNSCSENFKLEIFVHGALCYSVSGRCYWSSYLGGKSSLRGQCVQPCRRNYIQNNNDCANSNFSCCDLSLDILTKTLRNLSKINLWKIEGRKKGPHYVFYTVSAYKILRDHGKNSKMKKSALALLDNCLGRYRTHYNFLPQRPQNPIKIGINTASGVLIGKIKNSKNTKFITRQELLPGDILRVGYEDKPWHYTKHVTRYIPKKGKLYLRSKTKYPPPVGTPVFLKDRMEINLKKIMDKIDNSIEISQKKNYSKSKFDYSKIKLQPKRFHKVKQKILNMQVNRNFNKKLLSRYITPAVWLSNNILKNIKKSDINNLWVWLPPVVWPKSELKIHRLINKILDKGVKNFVLNMPWQITFFKQQDILNIWAGPFCNISNALNLKILKNIGFHGAIVSPELQLNDYISIAQDAIIPIGIVICGNWPICISRSISDSIKLNHLFKSPKGEGGWITQHGSEYWVFPNWKLNITENRNKLEKVGYKLFVNLEENIPHKIKLKNRPGLWNLKIGLK